MMSFARNRRWRGAWALGLVVIGLGALPALPAPSAAPAAQQNLSDLSAEDAAAIREAMALIEPIAMDPAEGDETRTRAVEALERLHEALGDWNKPGLLDWHVGLLCQARGRFAEVLLKSAQIAARSGQYHLGGVREFWTKMDAMAADQQVDAVAVERSHKSFDTRMAPFEKARHGSPAGLKPLSLTVKRYNLAAQLKPIPEPKPVKPKK